MTAPASIRRHLLLGGGSGIVARRVVARTFAAGWQVTSVALPGEAMPANRADVGLAKADLTDPHVVSMLLTDAYAIVHLAAPGCVAGECKRQWRIIVAPTPNTLASRSQMAH